MPYALPEEHLKPQWTASTVEDVFDGDALAGCVAEGVLSLDTASRCSSSWCRGTEPLTESENRSIVGLGRTEGIIQRPERGLGRFT